MVSAYSSPKIAKFKVPVVMAPSWKIKAIAQFKVQQAAKSMKNVSGEKNQIKLENEPSVQAVRPFSQIKIRDEDENIRREIDGLNKNSLIIRKEMQALSSIRVNLLWMLRKATLHETQRNHNG